MNVTLVINSVASVALPDGVTAGAFRYAILPKAGGAPLTQNTLDLTCTFADVPPGDYTAAVDRLGSDGNSIAAAITADFTVPVPVVTPVMADVPASITVTLA